jgi:threonylcarbamoyladenosine tRNA methylthiotransferase MtaB
MRNVPSFYVENFGCRAAQADGAAIARQFCDRGLNRAFSPSNAELVILNTCTVTASADQGARAAIRRIHRKNPGCQIIVTGCYAQRAPEEIAALPGVTQVIGNSHKHQLAEIVAVPAPAFVSLASLAASSRPPNNPRHIFVSDIFAHTELLAAPVFEGQATPGARTRPNLKVQDGCDNRCSFCVIPSVRGQSRSLPLTQVLLEVNALVASGYREVVISGINLGRWGTDLLDHPSFARSAGFGMTRGKLGFEHLVCAILAETSLEKLRLSSIEPMDWSHQLIGMMAESTRVAKHAHVPMQSGSDRVLRLMHRKYRPWHYREKIETIRAAMPTAAIGADVMVGFPGETEADFDETRRMIDSLPFTYLHVFTYSSRPGTPSATMRDQVPVHRRRERNRVLWELAAEKKLAFMQFFVGKEIEAITLGSVPTLVPAGMAALAQDRDQLADGSNVLGQGFTEALTDNYLKLRLKGRHAANRWIKARIERVEDGYLVGMPA